MNTGVVKCWCLNATKRSDSSAKVKAARIKSTLFSSYLLKICTYGSSSLSKLFWDEGLAAWLLHPAGLLIWTSAACLQQPVSDGTQLLAVVDSSVAEWGKCRERGEKRPANLVCSCNKVTFDPRHQTDASFIEMWWLAASLSDWMQQQNCCFQS